MNFKDAFERRWSTFFWDFCNTYNRAYRQPRTFKPHTCKASIVRNFWWTEQIFLSSVVMLEIHSQPALQRHASLTLMMETFKHISDSNMFARLRWLVCSV